MTLNNDIELSKKHYQQGLDFYAQGQYREAIKEHTKAINLNPSNLDALLDRSNAYCQIGKFKKAIENLNEQSLLLSNDAYYHHILGSAYFRLEEHDYALSYFNQSIKIDPTNPLVYFARGLIHSILGDYALAVEDLSIALKELRSLDIQNELSIAYRNLGMTYWYQKEKEKALYQLNRSIILNPNEAESYLYRGALYASLGHIKNACKDYIQSSEYASFLSEPFLLIGILYKKIGEKEKALEFYNKAIERDSNFAEAYLMRGFLKHEINNTIEAIRDFDAVSRIYSLKDRDSLSANFNSESRYFVHFIYSSFGMIWNPSLVLIRGIIKIKYDIESAINDFEIATKFINISSNNYQLLFDTKAGLDTEYAFLSLGIAYLYLGNYEKSLQNLNYNINLAPEYAYSYYLRGLLLSILEQHDKAIWDIQKAIKIFSQQNNQLGCEFSIKLLSELEQPNNSIDISSELQKIHSFFEYIEKRFDDITIHNSNELIDLKNLLNTFRNRQTEDSFRIDSLEVKSDNLMQRLILLEASICDDIEEGFSNIKVLSDKVIDLSKNLEELQNSSVGFNQNLEHWLIELNSKIKLKSPDTTLVVGRKGSKRILNEALQVCRNQLILVCPWLCKKVVNSEMMDKMQLLLQKNVTISIGWGYPENKAPIWKIRNQSITRNDMVAKSDSWKYNAISSLENFEKDYPNQFKLTQPRGTHEKYLVCDRQFAMITSHNFLTSDDSSPVLEVGIRTSETHIMEELVKLFENPIY